MCGRYADEMLDREYIEHMRVIMASPEPVLPRYNIALTQKAPVIRSVDGQLKLEELRWGFRVKGKVLPNARSETVFTLPSFAYAAKNQRCLVPATAWYEWQEIAGRKQPFAFRLKENRALSLAGIWLRWPDAAGDEEDIYVILTTDSSANAVAAPIHNRMPVILEGEGRDAWLDPKNKDTVKLKSLLHPYTGNELEAYPVSTYVNTPKNTDARCLDPMR